MGFIPASDLAECGQFHRHFFNTGRDTYVMLAGSVPGASQPVFSARRHLILTLMAVYMGTGILISTVIYFIYR
ncbi:hypothetical protein [uncultured Megasphaera sp.]|jgi:hypothetical protein|uniref:hypothetical protein n=1 Tax=uncultured Megasphaera sp. TaxID=165188 RepID=UPI002602E11B|nr:hypothetical protein [uncultured Megasphaera sp.]